KSNELNATPATVPGAPTLNTATGGLSSIALAWSPPASNGGSQVLGYRVYRSTASGAETLLTSLGNVTSYTDSGVLPGVTYFYGVSAFSGVGEGPLSNEGGASLTPPAPAPGPPSLDSATAGNTTVSLSWSAGSNGGTPITGYRVYRSTSGGTETLRAILGNV